MATDKITTTYDELERLGACKDELDKLLEWCKKHPENNGSYKQLRLTPADILESNGVGFLNWVLARTPRWESSFYSWGGRWEGSSAWAKEVSKKPEPNIGLINAQINSSYIKECRAEGEIRHKTLVVFGYPRCCEWPEGMRVEITVRPKREPRRLKAEQILVPENVGTKWRHPAVMSICEVITAGASTEYGAFITFNRPEGGVLISDTLISAPWEEVLE